MSQITIEVVNVSAPVFTKTTARSGGYNSIEVAYKMGGKINGKKLLDYASPTIYNQFLVVKPGETFVVTTEKNDKGYIDWVAAVPASPAEVASAAAPTASAEGVAAAPTGRGGRVVGNNYETADERAVRQAAIIRQATINMAIEYVNGAPEATLASILTLARQFEDHVYTDLTARAESLKAATAQIKG